MATASEWGLAFIVWIQQFSSPILDTMFRSITFMGEEIFFLLLIPFVWWCVEPKTGVRLAMAFLLSACLNVYLKGVFLESRPFEINPSVGLSEATGYGMPSGHAQSSVMVWGTLAYRIKKGWAWMTAVTLMLLIGFSRVYLGVHFPAQVLAGWGVGILFLIAFLGLYPRFEAWLTRWHLGGKVALAASIPIALVVIYPATDTVSATAVLLGMGVGIALARRMVPDIPLGTWWERGLRFLVGVSVIFAIYLGLKAVFPGETSALYVPFRFLRYSLVGLWVSFGLPWLFSRYAVSHGPQTIA